MSQDIVELVRAGYEAVLREDWSYVSRLLAADFEVNDPTVPVTGSQRGLDALLAARASMAESFDEFRYEVEEAIDLGERVLVRAHVVARGRESGLSLDGRMGHLWTFTNGRVSRLDVYGQWEEALEAVGMG